MKYLFEFKKVCGIRRRGFLSTYPLFSSGGRVFVSPYPPFPAANFFICINIINGLENIKEKIHDIIKN